MIFLWLLRIKSVLSTAITFIAAHWQEFIVLCLCLAVLWYRNAYIAEKGKFEAHIAADKQAYDMRVIENRIKEGVHAKDITELNNLHSKEIESIRGDYAKRNKNDALTIADLRKQLRDKLAADSFGLPTSPGDTERDTEVWRSSYAALAGKYQTLVDACTITTSDFNALRKWSDSTCELVGCK